MKKRAIPGVFWAMVLVLAVYQSALQGGVLAAETDGARPPSWAVPVSLAQSENFFRVTDGLYRSAQPSKAAMRAYESFGIKTVINLRQYHTDDDEGAGTGLTLVHLPTATRAVTGDAFVVNALQAIRDAEKPVLVHCMHGADRTGLIIAMYRMVEQGWNREDAIREMRQGGFGFHEIWRHIPAYLEQVDAAAIKKSLR